MGDVVDENPELANIPDENWYNDVGRAEDESTRISRLVREGRFNDLASLLPQVPRQPMPWAGIWRRPPPLGRMPTQFLRFPKDRI